MRPAVQCRGAHSCLGALDCLEKLLHAEDCREDDADKDRLAKQPVDPARQRPLPGAGDAFQRDVQRHQPDHPTDRGQQQDRVERQRRDDDRERNACGAAAARPRHTHLQIPVARPIDLQLHVIGGLRRVGAQLGARRAREGLPTRCGAQRDRRIADRRRWCDRQVERSRRALRDRDPDRQLVGAHRLCEHLRRADDPAVRQGMGRQEQHQGGQQ